ncbi:FG-GAP-like repeat-containing protein [Chitinophaga sp. S165]|uniref:FG-GAP-like repeat-containing protein n=1 Tax=Chitinophaga sp. S165 TaxID=2135462 RepID=UPI000D719F87|nr:FG-GAP-like repeat-containing protein [Chitinophaga sp. S165]PWV56398.1 IPT/TIG domain-containing protein [Chitinophaga sp. S165]
MYTLLPTTIQKWLLSLISFFLSTQIFAQPVIQSFAPVSGPVGTSVTITGTGFSAVLNNNIVFFGAVKATVTAAEANSLTVTVPAGATFMPISVTVSNLTAYSARRFIVTFPDGSLEGGGAYPYPDTLVSSLYPYAVAITDLNNDGKPDIAAVCNANVPASTLSVFSNTGTDGHLSFAAKKDFPIADMPYDIAAGDLDGDGKPDLAATYVSGGGNVSIYKNNSTGGAISLAAPVTYPTGSSPYRVLISDIDLDGKPDLVTLNYVSGTISVLRNTSTGGTISFAAKADIPTGLLPYSISIADFDGDGKPDIVTTTQQAAIVSIHRNTSNSGTFSFATKIDVAVKAESSGVTTGDVDGDVKTDIAVSHSSGFSILRNISGTGAISFAPEVDYPIFNTLYGPWDITMGDLDGDAKPDIAISNPNGTLLISQNISAAGSISFGPVATYYAPGAFRVAIGDLNADAKPELVVPEFTGSSVMVFRNRANEPLIISFEPVEGEEGDTITITGKNFAKVNTVSFGGTPASSFTIVNDATIRAVVGKGASGMVTATNVYGTSKLDGFIFHAPPVITAFTPTAGKTGDTITIKGTDLTGTTAVRFGGTPAASFTINSATSITAAIADGSGGSVSVTTPYGTSSLTGFTYYPPPVITSFTPTEGDQGTVITITGTGLSGASSVLVGGVPVASFTVQSANTITAVISEGATGSVVVTVPGGTDTSSAIFSFPPPVITSFSPLAAPAGSTVTITGANFRSDAGANQVFFGAVKATVTAASRTSLKVTVPTGATYAPLTVTVNNHTAYANKPFNTTFIGGDTAFTATSFVWKEGPEAINEWYHDGGRTIFMADMDGDGRPDLVSRNIDYKLVTVTRNVSTNGIVSFAYQKYIGDFNDADRPVRAAVGDVNGDGRPDIVINDNGTQIQVYRNTSTPGNLSFAPKSTVAQGIGLNDIIINDFDGDAKADIIAAGNNGQNAALIAYRNTGNDGVLSFTHGADIMLSSAANHLRTADFDNDGKTDLSFTTGNITINVLKNTSTKGSISFTNSASISLSNDVAGMALADFDNDDKMDMVASISNAKSFVVYRNTTAAGNISFVPALTYNIGHGQGYIAAGQLDGDGLPDIMVKIDSLDNNGNHSRLLLFRNTGAPGIISFAIPGYYDAKKYFNNDIGDGEIGDIDGDGKADIAVTTYNDNYISIFRNQQDEKTVTVCSTTDTTLTTDITSTKYQWQVNTGSGFKEISDNANYSGAATSTLKMHNVPVSWNGYYYRCVGDGTAGKGINLIVYPTEIQTGTISIAPEICAELPVTVSYIGAHTYPNSKIELWQSINGSTFSAISSQTYYSSQLDFELPKDNIAGNKRYFFAIIPPATLPCAAVTYTDTSFSISTRIETPLVAVDGDTLTVTNPDTVVTYAWFVQYPNWEWEEVGSGPIHLAARTGTYHVRASRRVSCYEDKDSDPHTIETLEIPLLTAEGFTLTVTNPDTAVVYTWEMKNTSGNWEEVIPAAADTVYRALKKGTYRVKGVLKSNGLKIKYSEEQTVLITGIDPVNAESVGIKLYPNPVSVALTIGPLKLTNRWQTLDIYSADGRLVLEGYNISNQTTVTLNTAHLVSGAYTVLLRRKQGPPVSIKFVKQ